jgi:hypothetical protein
VSGAGAGLDRTGAWSGLAASHAFAALAFGYPASVPHEQTNATHLHSGYPGGGFLRHIVLRNPEIQHPIAVISFRL